MQLTHGALTLALRESASPTELISILSPPPPQSPSASVAVLGEATDAPKWKKKGQIQSRNAIHYTAAATRLSSLLSNSATLSSESLMASCRLLHTLRLNVNLLDTRGLSNVIWSVGKIYSSHANAELQRSCIDLLHDMLPLVIQADVSDFSPQHLSNIIWAAGVVFGSERAQGGASLISVKIMSLVSHILEASKVQMSEFNSQGLANILWACASLQTAPSNEWMHVFFHQSLSGPNSVTSWDPRSTSMTLWSLGKLKITPPSQWFLSILDGPASISLLPNYDMQALCNVAWALSELDEKPSMGWIEALFKAALTKFDPKGSSSSKSFLQMSTLLSCLVKLQHHSSSTPCMQFISRSAEALTAASPVKLERRTFASISWALAKLEYRPSQQWLSQWLNMVTFIGLDGDSHSISSCLWAWSSLSSSFWDQRSQKDESIASNWQGPESWSSRAAAELSRRASEDNVGKEKEAVLLLLGSLVLARGPVDHDSHFISSVNLITQAALDHMERNEISYSQGQIITGLWSLASLGVLPASSKWLKTKVQSLASSPPSSSSLASSDQEVALLQWTLKKWGIAPKESLASNLESMGPRELAAKLCLVSKSMVVSSYLPLAGRLSSLAQFMSPTDLAMSLHACASIGYRPDQGWKWSLWSAFTSSAPQMSASEFALGLWSLSSLRLKPTVKHRRIVKAQVCRLIIDFEPLDVARLLHAASSLRLISHSSSSSSLFSWSNVLLRALPSDECSVTEPFMQVEQRRSLIMSLLHAGRLGLTLPAHLLSPAFSMLIKLVESSSCSPHDITSIMEASVLLAQDIDANGLEGKAVDAKNKAVEAKGQAIGAKDLFLSCVHMLNGGLDGQAVLLRYFTLADDACLLRSLSLQRKLHPSWLGLAELDGLLTTFFIISGKRIKPMAKVSSPSATTAAVAFAPSDPFEPGIFSSEINRPSFPPALRAVAHSSASGPPLEDLTPSSATQILHCLYWSSRMKQRPDEGWLRSCSQCLASHFNTMTPRELCDSFVFLMDAGHRPTPSWIGRVMGRILLQMESGTLGQGHIAAVTGALSRLDSKLYDQWKSKLMVTYS